MRHIEEWLVVVTAVKVSHPFATLAMVVLPVHLHAVWRLPSDVAGCGLCALQPGEKRPGVARSGLPLFDITWVHRARDDNGGMGWWVN